MFEHAIGKKIPGLSNATTLVFTCSTGSVLSGAAINGRVIDRLGLINPTAGLAALGKSDRCLVAEPFCWGFGLAGSTGAVRNVNVDVKLQHGDSSGGGDMADYSTSDQPVTANFWSTALTTDMVNWTTAPAIAFSNPTGYELTGTKRFLRAVGIITKFGDSTATGTDGMTAVLGVDFREFSYSNPNPASTTSSTTTS